MCLIGKGVHVKLCQRVVVYVPAHAKKRMSAVTSRACCSTAMDRALGAETYNNLSCVRAAKMPLPSLAKRFPCKSLSQAETWYSAFKTGLRRGANRSARCAGRPPCRRNVQRLQLFQRRKGALPELFQRVSPNCSAQRDGFCSVRWQCKQSLPWLTVLTKICWALAKGAATYKSFS